MKKIFLKERNIAFYANLKQHTHLPVVLLHGFCEDSRVWDDWLKLVPKLSTVCIDLPGFGASEVLSPLNMDDMADIVCGLLDHLKINRFHLVGHSMGGYVSMAIAQRQPQRLSSLCMFHSHPFADPEDRKEGRLKSMEFVRTNGSVPFVRQLIPKLFAYDYSNGYPPDVNRLLHYASQYPPEGIIAALEAMRIRPDRSQVLCNIPCPVLFFIGAHDTAIPQELSLAQTHLPERSQVEWLPFAGHMGMLEAPRETARAFREFLKFAES